MSAPTTSISPATVRRELRRLDFHKVDDTGRAGETWASRSDKAAPAVLVPRERDAAMRGYLETLMSAVDRLSWITGEAVDQIARRLSIPGARLELRVLHEMTEHHTLPARDAPEVVRGFVDVIKNGARTEFVGPRPDHRGDAGDDYNRALDGIQILAPSAGSFKLVAVVAETAEVAQLGFAIEAGEEPLAQASSALAKTVQSLETLAREERRAEDLSEGDIQQLVQGGVSLQLVNAVERLAFVETTGLHLEFTSFTDASLAQGRPSETVVLGDHHVSLARGLHRHFSKQDADPDAHVFGWVETAQADELSPEGNPKGKVVVAAQIGGKTRRVTMELGPDDFGLAKPGASLLRARGRLDYEGRGWHLFDPRAVQITNE